MICHKPGNTEEVIQLSQYQLTLILCLPVLCSLQHPCNCVLSLELHNKRLDHTNNCNMSTHLYCTPCCFCLCFSPHLHHDLLGQLAFLSQGNTAANSISRRESIQVTKLNHWLESHSAEDMSTTVCVPFNFKLVSFMWILSISWFWRNPPLASYYRVYCITLVLPCQCHHPVIACGIAWSAPPSYSSSWMRWVGGTSGVLPPLCVGLDQWHAGVLLEHDWTSPARFEGPSTSAKNSSSSLILKCVHSTREMRICNAY